MKEEFTIVKDFKQRPVVVRIVDESEGTIFVASEEEYLKKINGLDALQPIGFRRSNVFRYHDSVRSRLPLVMEPRPHQRAALADIEK